MQVIRNHILEADKERPILLGQPTLIELAPAEQRADDRLSDSLHCLVVVHPNGPHVLRLLTFATVAAHEH